MTKIKKMQRICLCVLMIICIISIGIFFFLKTGESIPILMYHHIDEDASNSMIVTPERFRSDMEYLKAEGYTALLPSDLARIKKKKEKMPEKPIMITFDDGYKSNYQYAYPILKETGMKAAIALICGNIVSETKEDAYFLSWDECREMAESGIIEIGCHTYNLHNSDNSGMPHLNGQDGVQRKKGENRKEYEERVGEDLRKGLSLIKEKTGIDCVYFSYPFGAGDSWFESILKDANIKVTVLTEPQTAKLRRGLYDLPRHRIDMDINIKDIFEK